MSLQWDFAYAFTVSKSVILTETTSWTWASAVAATRSARENAYAGREVAAQPAPQIQGMFFYVLFIPPAQVRLNCVRRMARVAHTYDGADRRDGVEAAVSALAGAAPGAATLAATALAAPALVATAHALVAAALAAPALVATAPALVAAALAAALAAARAVFSQIDFAVVAAVVAHAGSAAAHTAAAVAAAAAAAAAAAVPSAAAAAALDVTLVAATLSAAFPSALSRGQHRRWIVHLLSGSPRRLGYFPAVSGHSSRHIRPAFASHACRSTNA